MSFRNAHARTKVDWLDGIAATGSFACLIHCLALPLLISALPALSAVLSIPDSFHLLVFAFAVPAAVWAMMLGSRQHKRLTPAVLGGGGLVLLALGVFAVSEGSAEIWVTVAGSLLLSAAHAMNWQLRRCSIH